MAAWHDSDRQFDELVAVRVAYVVGLRSIEAQYGDDEYGDAEEWAETVPDLGENA
jgi:hypothetical protein